VTWQQEIARPQRQEKKEVDVEVKQAVQELTHAKWLLLVYYFC